MTQKRVLKFGQFVKCPFCEYSGTSVTNPGKWCASCFVEWYESRDGDWIVFDTKRKSPKFALAKAFGRAGGVKIDQTESTDSSPSTDRSPKPVK